MILTLFLALLALSGFVCWLGYYTDDEPYLTVGLLFLFLLSIVILTGNLEYRTGSVTNYTYTTVANASLQSETETFSYTGWDDNTSQKVGWGLAVVSVLGFAISLFTMGGRRIQDG